MSKCKPLFLLDECIPYTRKSRFYHLPIFVKAVKLVKPGTDDQTLYKTAEKKKLRVVTKDKGFIFSMVMMEKEIIYHDEDDNWIRIISKVEQIDKLELHKKYSDEITSTLLKSESIIIP